MVFELRKMRWEGNVMCMGKQQIHAKFWLQSMGKEPLLRCRHKCELIVRWIIKVLAVGM